MNPLLYPRYWPSWLAVGLVRLLGFLPFPLLWLLGMGLGRSAGRIALGRRQVALRNLEICLPELSPRERGRLVSRHFGYLGVAALAQGLIWGASRRRLERLIKLRFRERVDELLEQGQNLIVMMPHFVGLELGGAAFTALVHPGMYMYQQIRDPVIDARMRAGRTRFGALAIERQDDLRGLVRKIRQGMPFFYLPDQDAGPRRGIFVPFFGVMASTYPMLGRFAQMADAVVIPIHAQFRPWGQGLEVSFGAPLAAFPSGDEIKDAMSMNQAIETMIRISPAQYFWVHRRFKSRPPGEPSLYPRPRPWWRRSDS
jgi:Kdo2-lipid IVA lauroyltransferase/acyltransferase